MTCLNKILVLVLSFVVFNTRGQQDFKTNNNLKAIYVYNFTTLVDWPKEFKQNDFVIGVLGDQGLVDVLTQKYSSKNVGAQPIKIKAYKNETEVDQCHILFIANSQSATVTRLSKKLTKYSTLIVAESAGALESGACINFTAKDNKLAYELSKSNTERIKLILGKTILELAVKVS
ncbi:MAG: YfiR family protein [Flavobacteriales bacterium]